MAARLVLVVLVVSFLVAVTCAQQCTLPVDSPNIQVVGRAIKSGGRVQYDWSAVQLSVVVSHASAVAVNLADQANLYDVFVDGTRTQVLITGGGATSYTVATGLDPATSHVITLFKRTEASVGNVVTFTGFTLTGPSADGAGNCVITPATPPSKTGRIEFLGDSISCGYGVEGTFGCPWSPATENSRLTYANLVAEALGAELHLECWSGKGVVRNYGDPNPTSADPFPAKFTKALASTNTEWDFHWVPDAVVINLGTNDFSTPPNPSQSAYESGYEALIQTVRSKYSSNPKLQLFLACGPMSTGTPQCTYVQNVVNRVGGNVHFIDLQGLFTDPNTQAGCDWHPNTVLQQAMARKALTVIQPYWLNGGGPATQPSPAPPAPPPPAGFTFFPQSSAWWVAVTIGGASSVQINCNNGQGWQVMTLAGWAPDLWTFSPSNGSPCSSTMQFIVNGGQPQTVTAPF